MLELDRMFTHPSGIGMDETMVRGVPVFVEKAGDRYPKEER